MTSLFGGRLTPDPTRSVDLENNGVRTCPLHVELELALENVENVPSLRRTRENVKFMANLV